MNSETSGTPGGGSGQWIKFALAVSLGLNLVVVGLVAGAAWRFSGREGGGMPHAGPGQNYGAPFVRALPPEARRALHGRLRARAEGLPTRAERRALFAQMVEVLRAEPFDPEAVRTIFAAQARASQAVRDRAEEGWLELVGAMSAQERAAVADRLEAGLRRWRAHREGRGDR